MKINCRYNYLCGILDGIKVLLLFHIKNTEHPIILKHLNYKKASHNYTITLMYCVVLFTQANQSILPSPSEILRKFLLIYYDSKLALAATAYVEMKRGFCCDDKCNACWFGYDNIVVGESHYSAGKKYCIRCDCYFLTSNHNHDLIVSQKVRQVRVYLFNSFFIWHR